MPEKTSLAAASYPEGYLAAPIRRIGGSTPARRHAKVAAFAEVGMATVDDISRIVRARRAVARSAAIARVVGYVTLVLATVNVLLGRLSALVLVVLAALLVWSARRMVRGERSGALVIGGLSPLLLPLLVLPAAWLASGAYHALRHGEPAVFHNLSKTAQGGLRALLAHRDRPGVMRPLVGSMVLVVVWIALTPLTSGLVGFVVGPPTASLYRRARLRAALDVQSVLAADARPPILYLRSFADEDLEVRARWHWRRSLVENVTAWRERLEEVVARQLAGSGPVIAVGMPGEPAPRLGAAREYVSDDEWRGTIAARMEAAGVIAVSLGRGAGLRWELATAAHLGALPRCVFVFPNLDVQELRARWEALLAVIGGGWDDDGASVDVGRALTAVCTDGGVHVTSGRRRDEWHYEVAILDALERIAVGRPNGA